MNTRERNKTRSGMADYMDLIYEISIAAEKASTLLYLVCDYFDGPDFSLQKIQMERGFINTLGNVTADYLALITEKCREGEELWKKEKAENPEGAA